MSADVQGTGDLNGLEYSLSGGGGIFELMLGGTPAEGLVIGGGLIGASFPEPDLEIEGENFEAADGISVDLSVVTAFVNYYFDPRSGLHLHGALGFGVAGVSDEDGDSLTDEDATPTGGVLGLGLGWEGFVSDEWSLGVLGRYMYAPLSSDVEDVTFQVFTVSFIATLH